MEELILNDLPQDFAVIVNGSQATVIYDVTQDSLGTWVKALVVGECLQLFPVRSYKHRDLLRRLGRIVDEG